MQTKLTLRVNKELAEAAKQYADQRDTSLSRLVENYLRVLTSIRQESAISAPILQRLTGTLPADVSPDEYYQCLENKHA